MSSSRPKQRHSSSFSSYGLLPTSSPGLSHDPAYSSLPPSRSGSPSPSASLYDLESPPPTSHSSSSIWPYRIKRNRTTVGLTFVLMLLVGGFWSAATVRGATLHETLNESVGGVKQWSETAWTVLKEVVSWDEGVDPLDFSTGEEGERVSTQPRPRKHRGGVEEKFLGFLPHSGFHNQRSALQNALVLGAILNRTVLIPPIWIGWPTPTLFYDELQQAWTDQVAMHPTSFGLPASSLESEPAAFLPANYSDILPPHIPNAADLAHIRDLAALKAKNAALWESQGWVVRPDGYPITNRTEAECKSYSVECRFTYKDTFLAWDFLGDLDELETGRGKVKLVDRWDMREKSIEKILGVKRDDIITFKDSATYDLQFTDAIDSSLLIRANESPSHWKRLVSTSAMRELPQRVILVGSLFGTGRVRHNGPFPSDSSDESTLDSSSMVSYFARSLAFRNPYLLLPANVIRERLGGKGNYVGVHARVGDGVFVRKAAENMESVWRGLVGRLQVDEEVVEGVWRKIRPRSRGKGNARLEMRGMGERSDWAILDGTVEEELIEDHLRRRSPQSELDDSRSDSDDSSPIVALTLSSKPTIIPTPEHLLSLTCRSPLHTERTLLAFNTPLYLATDSRSPTTDPHLSIFFDSFPCTFILSDFDSPSDFNEGKIVDSVGRMKGLVNKADGIGLGRLLVPFLEAIVASKGRITVGTPGSTFSKFAQSDLHDAYELDED